jgi:hypothetical protein
LNISGFKQTQLAYFGEDLQYINEIEISIKKEDFTF